VFLALTWHSLEFYLAWFWTFFLAFCLAVCVQVGGGWTYIIWHSICHSFWNFIGTPSTLSDILSGLLSDILLLAFFVEFLLIYNLSDILLRAFYLQWFDLLGTSQAGWVGGRVSGWMGGWLGVCVCACICGMPLLESRDPRLAGCEQLNLIRVVLSWCFCFSRWFAFLVDENKGNSPNAQGSSS